MRFSLEDSSTLAVHPRIEGKRPTNIPDKNPYFGEGKMSTIEAFESN